MRETKDKRYNNTFCFPTCKKMLFLLRLRFTDCTVYTMTEFCFLYFFHRQVAPITIAFHLALEIT